MAMREWPAPEVALPPLPQRVWGGLAVVNFTCGGAGAGPGRPAGPPAR